MKSALNFFAAIVAAILFSSACNDRNGSLLTLKSEVISDLRGNVLPFWIRYAPAPDGGFYGQVSRMGVADERADRGGVLNARILWSFSAAYDCFRDSTYLAMADRARDYFLNNFMDRENGGVYWLIRPDGEVSNASKYTYAVTYAIYGLVEHYRAGSDRRSLDEAIKLYHTLEDKGKDSGGGYIESFTSDWKRLPGYENNASRTLNAHLHVLEAYVELYKEWPEESLGNSLEEVFNLLSEVFYDSGRRHFLQYFDDDWNPQSEDDSYGHDVETGWLLCKAADVLGKDEYRDRAQQIAVDVTRACLEEGLTGREYMASGRYGDKISPHISWWQEIEGIIACVNAWQISGETFFAESALTLWNFIKDKMIDRDYGEWFSDCMDGEPLSNGNKISMWRCPYHTVRLAAELKERL